MTTVNPSMSAALGRPKQAGVPSGDRLRYSADEGLTFTVIVPARLASTRLPDKPLADIVSELNLGDRLAAALLRREGELGALLQLVESVEHPDLSRTLSLLAQCGSLSLSDLSMAEIEAMCWANQVAETTA